MAPDLAQIGMTLMFVGCVAFVALCRPGIDLAHSILSAGRTVWTSLYAKGPQA